MQRILVIGNAGAGKSTFSKKLAQKLSFPLVHLDRLYWCGNWEHRSREEFDRLLQQQLQKPQWIMDGNFSRTIPHRLQYCDTVFFFDLPVICCLWGVTKRVFQSYGKTRSDMGGNCPERFDRQKLSLYKGILSFGKRRKELLQLLDRSEANVIVFKSHRQADQYLHSLDR